MKNAAAILALLPLVAAHGFIKSPAPRRPGDAYKAACGDQPFYQQSSDINGNVQGIKQVVGQDFKAADCNLWLCKGFQFDDNKDNVQKYSLGEKIPFEINIAAPHTGYANVSVVKTSSDTMIGEPLIEFENYAANAGTASNNTAFSVTLPTSLGGDCTKAGECVLQWFWDAPDINQTYESCVDFVVGAGSGSAPAPSSGSGAEKPATSAPAAEQPAATSAAAEADDEDCDDEEEPVASTTAVAEKPAATTLQAVAISSAADSGSAQPTSAPGSDDDEDCDDEEPIADEDEDCDEEDDQDAGDDDEECPADDY